MTIRTCVARWLVVVGLVGAVVVDGRWPAAAASAEVTVERIAGEDRIATAIAVSQQVHDAAPAAVIARADDPADALAAAPLAVMVGGPLLLTPRDRLPVVVVDELDRLGVTEVVLLGGSAAISEDVEAELADRYAVRRVAGADRFSTATAVAGELETPSGAVVVAGFSFPDALSAAPLAAHLGWPVLLTLPDRLPEATAAWLEDRDLAEVLVVGGSAAIDERVVDQLRERADEVRRIAGTDRYGTGIEVHRESRRRGMGTSHVWLATGRNFPDALAAGPAAAAAGDSLLLVDGADLRDHLPVARELRALAEATTDPFLTAVLVGGGRTITPDAPWQLEVVVSGRELPRGGFTLFPHRRVVAFYGHHSEPRMGVLGEQPPDEAYERLVQQAAGYEAAGRPLLPTFELIVSVATAGAGPDGDYSDPSSAGEIQPWLDAARRHDTYLLLDIQPGRSDFLSEVRRYERFLVEPDVGVALDPEWRMDADERPGDSVGEVHADEVNAVIAYLQDLVRRHRLPQKLLVVHQFQTRMVEEKDRIGHPPELAVLFHMDGHGSRAQKQRTYAAVSDTTGRWWNGFKLFYDEDHDMYSPGELLAETRPVPDMISYQ